MSTDIDIGDLFSNVDGDSISTEAQAISADESSLFGETTEGTNPFTLNSDETREREIASTIIGYEHKVIADPVFEQDGNAIAASILEGFDNSWQNTILDKVSNVRDEAAASAIGTDNLLHTDEAHTHTSEPKFGSGCDCGFNPGTCGAGYACRWQR